MDKSTNKRNSKKQLIKIDIHASPTKQSGYYKWHKQVLKLRLKLTTN